MAQDDRDYQRQNNGRDGDHWRERMEPGYSSRERDYRNEERFARDWRGEGYRDDERRGQGFYGGYEGERRLSRGQGGYYEGNYGQGRYGYDQDRASDDRYGRGRNYGRDEQQRFSQGDSAQRYDSEFGEPLGDTYGRNFGDRGGPDYRYRAPRQFHGGAGEASRDFGSYETEGGRERDLGYAQRRGPHFGKGPRGYERSDDRLLEQICDRLMDDEHLDASFIDVEVAKGEVTLSGEVEDRFAKRRAEDCAEAVSGVKHVQNNLRLRGSSSNTGASATGGDKRKMN